MECISAFLDDDDEELLCRQFSHQSTRVFSMFIQSGVDCSQYMDDDDVSIYGSGYSTGLSVYHYSENNRLNSRVTPVVAPLLCVCQCRVDR